MTDRPSNNDAAFAAQLRADLAGQPGARTISDTRRQAEATAAVRDHLAGRPRDSTMAPEQTDVDTYQRQARAAAYRPNPRLDELADQAAAEPGALHRAGVPLALRGLAALHETFRTAHDEQQTKGA